MAPAVESNEMVDAMDASVAPTGTTSKPVVGIIYPPPEIRNILDKTANFVARNGPEFESRIRQNEINNPKFNFLNQGNPYHAYYQHKVREFREGKGNDAPAPVTTPTAPSTGAPKPLPTGPTPQQLKQQELLKQMQEEMKLIREPPPDFEYIVDPPSISALDLDIVKLTAQFVARNGRQFLTNLMNREAKNYQFDFLRPQHSLFQYFTRLLEQYTKILIPPKTLVKRLTDEATNSQIVLDQVKHRVVWSRHQENQRRKEEEEAERERVSYAQIDWHDFVVVETVDYQAMEQGHFPPPTTPEEVGARMLIQERLEEGQEIEMQLESDEEMEEGPPADSTRDMLAQANTQVQDMDESSEEEGDSGKTGAGGEKGEAVRRVLKPPSTKAPPLPMAAPPIPENVVVRKDYDPKAARGVVNRAPAPDEYLISPITGERIPAAKVAEHMRIGLLDPRWVEQRDRQILDKITGLDTVYAPGSAIEHSLKSLAERRTDIFGVGVEETAIGKKIGEEEPPKTGPAAGTSTDKVWENTTTNAEISRAPMTVQDQIQQIQKVQGLLQDPSAAVPASTAMPTPVAPKMPPGTTSTAHPPTNLLSVPRPLAIPSVPLMGAPQPMLMVPLVRPAPVVVPGAGNQFLGAPPSMPSFMQPQPPVPTPAIPAMMPPMEEEPATKRARNEDQLIPENIYLAQHPGPVSVHVIVPVVNDRPGEWNLQGQTLTLSVPLSEPVSALKGLVHQATGLPPTKQKMLCDGLYFKDTFTLAYYNLAPDARIFLQLKERGGRKK